MHKVIVVGIMGVGHSGSTIVSIALGNHPNIEAVGELHKLPRFGWSRDESRRCACGAPVYLCPYWREVYVRWTERVGAEELGLYIRLQDLYERSDVAWLRVLVASRLHTERFCRYAQMTAALYEAIRDVSGKGVIVDSSKSPMRNYALLCTGALDLRLIHLVRDGRGIVWSKKRPRIKNIEGGIPHDSAAVSALRTSQEWMFTNLKSEWVARQAGAEKARCILYERFVEKPDVMLQEIGGLVGEDLSPVAALLTTGNMMQIGHVVGGNHVRMAGQIALRKDTEWTRHLPNRDRRIFWLLAGSLARHYGYRARGEAPIPL
ncbi:MAG: hypothetical protein IT328_14120 [Caldilineaceae bacterium]|nr:hypothetical protein [Caldilineaceae bacterium]